MLSGDSQPDWPTEFDTLKSARFGFAPTETGDTELLAAKGLVFRYCLFADKVSSDDRSGMSEVLGDDFFVTLGAWTDPSDDDYTGTFMHEFGHALGLRHGGADDINHKPNYKSVMNYFWQTPKDWSQTTWSLDYSRTELRERIETQAGGLLAFDNVDFKDIIYLSKFYEAIEDIDGVEFVTVTEFRRENINYPLVQAEGKIELAAHEIPRFPGIAVEDPASDSEYIKGVRLLLEGGY